MSLYCENAMKLPVASLRHRERRGRPEIGDLRRAVDTEQEGTHIRTVCGVLCAKTDPGQLRLAHGEPEMNDNRMLFVT